MESVYQSNVDPLRANNSHSIALQLIGHDKKVLEVGSAGGHVTTAIKSQNNYVVAIEKDGRFYDQLLTIADKAIITDLDWLDLREKCGEEKFDVVLAGDVLEHCLHPDLVLLQFHNLLEKDGYIVLSIPNIAHGDVRLSLLQGHFKYRETGLLDQTHIRFFTRDTLELLLSRNGFETTETYGTTAELGTTEFGPVPSTVPSEAIDYVRADRDSNIYQFVVKARPKTHFSVSPHTDGRQTSNDQRINLLLAQISEYQSLAAARGFLLETLEGAPTELETSRNELHELHGRLSEALQQLQQTKSDFADLIVENRDLGLLLLAARDSMIGLTAQSEEMKHRLQRQRKNHQKHLAEIHSSTTWRIGRVVTLPIRLVKKLIRRQ
jgi:2-polyprenyl-3-methyl-5-hydroxy-6-metoxy-1,4-benzoquinol methylase